MRALTQRPMLISDTPTSLAPPARPSIECACTGVLAPSRYRIHAPARHRGLNHLLLPLILLHHRLSCACCYGCSVGGGTGHGAGGERHCETGGEGDVTRPKREEGMRVNCALSSAGQSASLRVPAKSSIGQVVICLLTRRRSHPRPSSRSSLPYLLPWPVSYTHLTLPTN